MVTVTLQYIIYLLTSLIINQLFSDTFGAVLCLDVVFWLLHSLTWSDTQLSLRLGGFLVY